MAVVERLSTHITNRDAVPRVMNNPAAAAGNVKGFVGTVETVNGDSIGSTYRVASVPSNAVMHELKLYSDDIGATTIADIGLYETTEKGGAVVDADFFGSAVSLKDGALNGADVLHESGVFSLENAEKPLWSALGLSEDPKKMYDIVFTLTAAADAAGTICAKGRYAQ